MWQAEARAVVRELEANLTAEQQRLVDGIPLVFDPSPTESTRSPAATTRVRRSSPGPRGCSRPSTRSRRRGRPTSFSGRAPTTRTRRPCCRNSSRRRRRRAVLPATSSRSSTGPTPRRVSRAHEMFDEIAAFTFGHELAHHYRGHTGCAHGQPAGVPSGLADTAADCCRRRSRSSTRRTRPKPTTWADGRARDGQARAGDGAALDGGGRAVALRLLRAARRRRRGEPARRLLRTHPAPVSRPPSSSSGPPPWRVFSTRGSLQTTRSSRRR